MPKMHKNVVQMHRKELMEALEKFKDDTNYIRLIEKELKRRNELDAYNISKKGTSDTKLIIPDKYK